MFYLDAITYYVLLLLPIGLICVVVYVHLH